mgnify:CR=1 FL=1
MKSREATSAWKKRIVLASLVIGLLATSLVVRHLVMKPERVQAQAPAQSRPAASNPAVPATTPRAARQASTAADATDPRTLGVVAVVNGEKITRQQLARESLKRYGEELLEKVINQQLIEQACATGKVIITQRHVDEEIDRMAKKFGLSRDLFLQTIRDDRQMPIHEYRQEIWGRLALKQLADASIQVTEEDLNRAFETEYGPRVRVRMIVSRTAERAEQLRTLALQDPDRFGDLAKEHSDDKNSASVRGQIPPIRKHVEEPALEKAAFGLAEGQVSGVIAMAGQFIVLKCEKRLQPVYVAKQFQTDARRRLADRVRFQKMRSAAAGFFQQLQQTAKITNVYNAPQLSQQMPGVVALVNGRKITERMLAEQCISSYGNLVLDVEINRQLLEQALKQRKLQVLRQDLDLEIARTADSYGFIKPDGSPDVAAWFRKVTQETNVSVDLYVRDAIWPTVALKKLVGKKIQVSEEDMQKGFESHYGPRVEVLAIVLNNHRQATTVWELAKNNPTEYYFGQLAEQYSVEPVSRSNAGQVPPIRRHGGRPHIEEEVFRLKPGELSGIVAIGDKYLVMHCLGLTDPVVTELAVVHDELYKNLHENKLRMAMNREFDSLKTRGEVVNFLQPGNSTAAIQPAGRGENLLQR